MSTMTKINIKNYFIMFVLILSALSVAQNNAFAISSPNIGTASNFAVLGSSTVTNTGNTIITGNLGVSPGTAITGFPPGAVTGTTYAGGPVAAHAHADAATAFTNLNAATCTTTEPAVADIGGQTLKPGVYCFPSSAAITGTLTLSGNGVYIFKIGSTLTTAAGNSQVVLTNSASSSNIFWAVGSSATLGTGSVLKGTVIAYSSITSTTGATVDGRLLAINGAVTLDTNHITVVGIGPKIMADAISGNSQCTVTFPSGAIDLGSNVQYANKVYPPGVYCIDGAANIGSGPITLSGNGAHIFKINGAFNQAANTDVILANGALVSGVIWAPTGATTIGANSHLIGTVNGAPITIGANSDINGIGPAKIMADAIQVIPEFGTIAALILAIAIVSIIAVSAKTRLIRMPRYN